MPSKSNPEKNSFVIPVKDDDILLLAKLIQAEGEAEPIDGKIAIGAVVVNRVNHPDFPNTISGVIFQPGQFETVSNNRIYNISKIDPDCMKAAKKALNGDDPTNGSVFFYNPNTATNQWLKSKKVNVALGKHNFVM